MRTEIERIQALVEQARSQLHDPRVGLPQRMRLNVLKAELDAYVRGLLFALAEVDESETSPAVAGLGGARIERVS